MKKFSEKTDTEYYEVIDYSERCKLWNIYCEKMVDLINKYYKHLVYIIDIRESFKNNGFKNYLTEEEDHHPDISKTQYLIINQLKNNRMTDTPQFLISLVALAHHSLSYLLQI